QSIIRERENYAASAPVPELNSGEEVQAEDVGALLEAAGLMHEKIEYSLQPIADTVVQILTKQELEKLEEGQKTLRIAAARLVALRGGWNFAYEIVRSAEVSDAEISTIQTFIERERKRLQTMRAQRIAFVINDVRSGLARDGRDRIAPTLEEYAFELAGYRDLQSVALLKAELDVKAAKITAHRAQEGDAGTAAFPWKQNDRDLVTLALRVLGNLGLGEAAVDAMQSLSEVVEDQQVIMEMASALGNTRSVSAHSVLFQMRNRVGMNSDLEFALRSGHNRLPLPELSSEPTFGELEEVIDALILAKAYSKALEAASLAVALYPNFAGFHNERGCAQWCLRDHQAAIVSFNKAVEIQSHYPEALGNLGHVYSELRMFENAIDHFYRAIHLRRNYVDAWCGLVDVRLKTTGVQAAT
ncbi:MAG: hypothetical protein KDB07_11865, partial [Planctomycetes bacterium]|nr:hypothetical protein [Planctomycetota bacterium]